MSMFEEGKVAKADIAQENHGLSRGSDSSSNSRQPTFKPGQGKQSKYF